MQPRYARTKSTATKKLPNQYSALLTLSLLECQNLKLRQQRARASASNLVGRLAYVQSARSVQQHFWADGNSETELN